MHKFFINYLQTRYEWRLITTISLEVIMKISTPLKEFFRYESGTVHDEFFNILLRFRNGLASRETTDRRTDDDIIANMNLSSRSLKTLP